MELGRTLHSVIGSYVDCQDITKLKVGIPVLLLFDSCVCCLVDVCGVCSFCFDWLGVSCFVTYEPRHVISNNVAFWQV